MALHILPSQEDFGSRIGSIIGTGLGQGLSSLAQNKLSEIQQQKSLKQLQNLGFTPEQSQILGFIKDINPQMYTEYLGRALENMTGGRSDQSQEYAQQKMASQLIGQPSIEGEMKASASASNLFTKGLSEKEKEARHKFTKDVSDEVLKAKKTARTDLRDLSRLQELNESGKLDTAGYVEFLKNADLDIPSLMNPESEEFQKIQQGFLKNAKQYFGARVTDNEINQFLKTIPTLSQSPEGRKRVIANLKYMARAAEEYYKTYEEIIKENKGIPPFDLRYQLEKKLDGSKRLDNLSDQFRKDLERPVPKGQNRIITALQAAAGKALGGNVLGKTAEGLGQGAGAIAGGKLIQSLGSMLI